MAVRPLDRSPVPDARRRSRRPHLHRYRARQLDDLAAIGLTWDGRRVADRASAPLRRGDRRAGRPRICCTNAIAAEGISPRRRERRTRHRARTRERAATSPTPNARPGAPRSVGRRRCGCAPTRSSIRFTICCTASTPGSSTTSWSVAVTASGLQPRRRGRRRGAGHRPGGPRRRSAVVVAAAGVSGADCWVMPEPTYAHVALVLNEDGARLAKRDGAVTLAEIGGRAGAGTDRGIPWLASDERRRDAASSSTRRELPRRPWIYPP